MVDNSSPTIRTSQPPNLTLRTTSASILRLMLSLPLATATATATLSYGAATVFSPSLRCPPANQPFQTLPTPSYNITPSHPGVFTVCAEVNISAPLHLVHSTLLDFNSYHVWNPFVVAVTGLPANVTQTPAKVYVGMPMTFHSQGLLPFGTNASSNEVVTVIEPKLSSGGAQGVKTALSAWRYDDGVGGSFQRDEHPNLITEIDDGGGGVGRSVRLVSYESYFGPGAVLVDVALRRDLQAQFVKQIGALKEYVEGMSSL